jgi:hypothetical protein
MISEQDFANLSPFQTKALLALRALSQNGGGNEMLTGRQACELIVYALQLPMTPKQVWEADRHGELWHVYAMLAEAEHELSKVGLGPRTNPASPPQDER